MEILVKEDVSCYASETQQKVLGIISGIDIIAKEFFITGGTALSVFFLHHRASEDIDFFSTEFRDLNKIHTTLKRTFKNDLTLIQSSSEFYSYLIKEVKVDFVFDPLSTTEKRPLVNLKVGKEIFIDTLDNIGSNKLSAVASRFEAKDIIDFYFINKIVWDVSKEKSFLACYDMARKKEALLDDPAMAAYQIEELLNRVLSKKEEILPVMRTKVDWNSFEKDLRFYIELLYRMERW
jgi:predicted nucleotidyltransferase component of viral defense system